MHTKHKKRATLAQSSPTGPTPATQTAGDDKEHNAQLVSAENIRLCAYRKWEAAGKPTGDSVQFWLEAEQELVESNNEQIVQRGGRHGYHEHERLETEKAAAKEHNVSVDSHYRDNNRMFQRHGDRGHRQGGGG